MNPKLEKIFNAVCVLIVASAIGVTATAIGCKGKPKPAPELGGIDRGITGATAVADQIQVVADAVDKGIATKDRAQSNLILTFASDLAKRSVESARTLSTNLEMAKVGAANQIAAIEAKHADAIAVMQKKIDDANKFADAAEDRALRAESHWGYRVGRIIDRAWFWLVIAGVAALALRAVSLSPLLAGGPIGAAFAFVSTAIFGVLSGGFSVIQAVFDNIWFRKVKPGVQQ